MNGTYVNAFNPFNETKTFDDKSAKEIFQKDLKKFIEYFDQPEESMAALNWTADKAIFGDNGQIKVMQGDTIYHFAVREILAQQSSYHRHENMLKLTYLISVIACDIFNEGGYQLLFKANILDYKFWNSFSPNNELVATFWNVVEKVLNCHKPGESCQGGYIRKLAVMTRINHIKKILGSSHPISPILPQPNDVLSGSEFTSQLPCVYLGPQVLSPAIAHVENDKEEIDLGREKEKEVIDLTASDEKVGQKRQRTSASKPTQSKRPRPIENAAKALADKAEKQIDEYLAELIRAEKGEESLLETASNSENTQDANLGEDIDWLNFLNPDDVAFISSQKFD